MAWRFMSSLTANTTGNRAVAAAASVGIVATCSDRPRPTAFAESIAVRGVSGVRLRQEAPPGKDEASRRALSQCKATWDSTLAGRMDPDVQKAADEDNAVPWIPWEEQSLAEVRTGCMKGLASCAAESKARYWSQQATVHTTAIPASSVTGSDESTLLLRTYQPTRRTAGREKDEERPIIMFFHGGGFCICDPIELFDYVCKRLAAMTDCVVCSVQYRQAPEHPFPVAPEDCFQATTWCVEHASEFGGDPRRIATCGDSAGGNLAAVVALMARDRGYPDISLQICLCPVTDWDFTTPSYKEFSDPASSPHLHAAQMHWYARRYLQRLGDIVNPWAAPLRAPTLDGVAPGIVINAEFDVLRSEGEAYARRLAAAGRLIRCTTYPGVMHDFYLRFHYSRSDQAWDDLVEDIQRVFFNKEF